MLLEIAIGDAFGAGYEFLTPSLKKIGRYVKHPKHKTLKAGCYTDDTQMSIAIVLALLSGRPLTKELFVEYFLKVFHRDPRPGYAGRFYEFLYTHKDVDSFLRDIKPFSNKNGAAMRAVPLGRLPLLAGWEASDIQASITHDTRDGLFSSSIVTSAARYLNIYHSRKGLKSILSNHLVTPNFFAWNGFVDCLAMPTVSAAITGVLEHNSQKELLLWCVNLGGDIDSVAAIAMGLASFIPDEIKPDLSPYYFDKLENGPYGRDYLIDLDKKLAERFSGVAF